MNPSTLNLLKRRGYKGGGGVLHNLRCVINIYCQMSYEDCHKQDHNALVQWLTSSFSTLKICIQIVMSKPMCSIALVPSRICSQSTLELAVDCLVQPCELLWVPTIAPHTLEYMVPHNMGTNDNYSDWGSYCKDPVLCYWAKLSHNDPKSGLCFTNSTTFIILTLVMRKYIF